jgi:Bacterial Ig-like domain (group 2)
VLQSIDVIASQLQLPLGLSQNLQAVGHLSDGSTVDLTSLVSWASGNPDVATVASGGLLTSLGAGSTLVTAADPASGIQGSLPLQVTPAVLQSLEVVPAQLSVLLGLVQPLTAVGHYSDGSTAELTNGVQWSSDNPLLAAVNSAGSVLGLGLGDTTLHALEPQSGLKSGAAVSVLSALSGLLP